MASVDLTQLDLGSYIQPPSCCPHYENKTIVGCDVIGDHCRTARSLLELGTPLKVQTKRLGQDCEALRIASTRKLRRRIANWRIIIMRYM
jgi:hypothetical protein